MTVSHEGSMVERVAAAIRQVARRFDLDEPEGAEHAARAAIAAMREPTERMAYSGSWAVGPGGDRKRMAELTKAYTAMIAARPERGDNL